MRPKGNPGYVLITETRRKLYYIHSSGKVLSISKDNKKKRHWLQKRNYHGTISVRIGNREISVLKILVESFYSDYLNFYGKSYRVLFINGNKSDLRVSNLYVQIGETNNVQSNC